MYRGLRSKEMLLITLLGGAVITAGIACIYWPFVIIEGDVFSVRYALFWQRNEFDYNGVLWTRSMRNIIGAMSFWFILYFCIDLYLQQKHQYGKPSRFSLRR